MPRPLLQGEVALRSNDGEVVQRTGRSARRKNPPRGVSPRGMLSVFLIFPPQERQLLSGMSPTMMTKSLGMLSLSVQLPKPTR